MVHIHHLNCLEIASPLGLRAIGHCLLIETDERLILVDTGIGLVDIRNPQERIGQERMDRIGYRFQEKLTAYRQIEALGLGPSQVSDCIISHLDEDHIGGLADFPQARVHLAREELDNFRSENPRYLKTQLSHQPIMKTYDKADVDWFGLEARKVDINLEAYLVPLFGHTWGHCGLALKHQSQWLFYVGDAYYLRAELSDPTHPVNELAKNVADSDALRIKTLDKIRQFIQEHPEVEVYGYHDATEFAKFF